jgi:acyl-CoA reductase-like NAD-dependent aldehyde dehydrogenase
VVGYAAAASAADAEDAVRAAHEAWPAWAALPVAERTAMTLKALEGLDAEHAMKIGRRLRTGVTFFNNHNATAVDERAPFGGFNASGIGRELGREGMHEFSETHVMAMPSEG